MKALILAAGYATRLYPLTKNQPKPLLPVNGKPMLEHLLDRLRTVDQLNEILVVTNEKFAKHFRDWQKEFATGGFPVPVRIINDGTTNDDDKLGAIGDIHLAMEQSELDEDLLVAAGDNLFNADLSPFVDYCQEINAPVLAVHDLGDPEKTRPYCSISINEQARITFFEEKAEQPQSSLIGIALYYYPKDHLGSIRKYIAEENNPDQPGRLIEWLYKKTDVYTWKLPGIWFDIGSLESLNEANTVFTENHENPAS